MAGRNLVSRNIKVENKVSNRGQTRFISASQAEEMEHLLVGAQCFHEESLQGVIREYAPETVTERVAD
ncbi:MAG: hypothetical protein K2Y39_05510, partial [Candidatus Obscuribacterales bacterium]|nr:hypothetical protein [Candidatus Obscuribacterales bacterium]